MQRRLAWTGLAVSVLTIWLTGCHDGEVRFRADRGRDLPQRQYVPPPEPAREQPPDLPREIYCVLADSPNGLAAATVSARGFVVPMEIRGRDARSPVPGLAERIEIRISVQNGLRKTRVTVPLARMRIVGNGVDLGWKQVVDAKQEERTLTALPGQQVSDAVVYELPPRQLAQLGEFRLQWQADIGKRVERQETAFWVDLKSRRGEVRDFPFFSRLRESPRPPRHSEDD